MCIVGEDLGQAVACRALEVASRGERGSSLKRHGIDSVFQAFEGLGHHISGTVVSIMLVVLVSRVAQSAVFAGLSCPRGRGKVDDVVPHSVFFCNFCLARLIRFFQIDMVFTARNGGQVVLIDRIHLELRRGC